MFSADCSHAANDRLDESQPEEILLDANAEAKKYSFYMLGSFAVSPDHSKLAYAEDTTGEPFQTQVGFRV